MRRYGARLALAGLLAVVLATLAACGGSDSDSTTSASTSAATTEGASTTADSTAAKSNLPDGPITVGLALGKTGFMAPYDGPPAQMAQMAVDAINSDGGIDGHQIKLIESDTKSDRAQATTAANELLDKGAKVLMVSCDFDYGSPSAIAASAKQVVSISPCAAPPEWNVDTLGPLSFTMATGEIAYGKAMAQFAYDKGYRNAFVLEDPSLSAPKAFCSNMVDAWSSLDGTAVAGKATTQQDDTSFNTQISDIKSAGDVDVIFLCSYPPGGAVILKQMRAAGVDQPVRAYEAFDGTYWQEGVPNISDVFYPAMSSMYGDDPRPEVNELFKAAEQKTGAPAVTSYGLYGYLLMQALAAGIEAGGTVDGADLAAALEKLPEDATVLGSPGWNADDHQASGRPVTVMGVQGGKHKFVELVHNK